MNTNFTLKLQACGYGAILPVVEPEMRQIYAGHVAEPGSPIFSLNVESGSIIQDHQSCQKCFTVAFKSWLPRSAGNSALLAPFLKATWSFEFSGSMNVEIVKKGWTAAIITLSDKGAEGLRQDKSGPALREILEQGLPGLAASQYLLPDEAAPLKALLVDLALCQRLNLIVTNGGTGLSPRDITPQTTLSVIDRELPGFSFLMLRESSDKTPNAAVSRAVCGILGKCIIINVPGSMRGATENLRAVMPALPHALAKLNGDTEDCGG